MDVASRIHQGIWDYLDSPRERQYPRQGPVDSRPIPLRSTQAEKAYGVDRYIIASIGGNSMKIQPLTTNNQMVTGSVLQFDRDPRPASAAPKYFITSSSRPLEIPAIAAT